MLNTFFLGGEKFEGGIRPLRPLGYGPVDIYSLNPCVNARFVQ